MNCPDCSEDMDMKHSHWEYISATERVPVKYYECPHCGKEAVTDA